MKTGIFFLCVVFLLAAKPAEAHILATDHTIGAIMHTDPDDDVIAGKPTAFFFDVKDTTNVFSPLTCTCVFHISHYGKELYSQPLFQKTTDLTSAIGTYIFTDPGDYTVTLTGMPLSGSTFQSFTLIYPIHVEKMAKKINTALPIRGILFYGLPLILVFIFLFFAYRKHRTLELSRSPSKTD